MSRYLPTAAAVDAWLPQTQCTRCGYPRCLDYAEAVACGEAQINRCPPGGDVTIAALADLLGRSPLPPAAECGAWTPRVRALIDEQHCIGCTKCLPVCPVDAIIGGPQRMHTVVSAFCTGCGLCLAPCPVECIALVDAPGATDPWPDYSRADAARFRAAAARHFARLARHGKHSGRPRRRLAAAPGRTQIRREIAEAVARVRQRRRSSAT